MDGFDDDYRATSGLFVKLEVVHTWEGLGQEHRHGDGPTERHGLAEAVLRRA